MKYCVCWHCDDMMLRMLIPVPISVYFFKRRICIRLYLAYVFFAQGETGVPCPHLLSLVDPSFYMYGRDLLLAVGPFKDPCAGFGRLLWNV